MMIIAYYQALKSSARNDAFDDSELASGSLNISYDGTMFVSTHPLAIAIRIAYEENAAEMSVIKSWIKQCLNNMLWSNLDNSSNSALHYAAMFQVS